MASSARPLEIGLGLLRELVRTVAPSPARDGAFEGEQVASVPVSLSALGSDKATVVGTLSIQRGRSGAYWIGVELPTPILGGLMSPVRQFAFSLDEVLDVVWTSSFRSGTLVLTPMTAGGFRDLPTSPHGPVTFRVARKDRAAAERLAKTIALVDLPV